MKQHKAELSALLDGELESHEAQAFLGRAGRSDELQATWRAYVLIRDQLRGESPTPADLATSVMERLSEEPVVLAPNNLRPGQRQHSLLALAASLAGVAVVGWMALAGGDRGGGGGAEYAAATAASASLSLADRGAQPLHGPVATVSSRAAISEYLVAHHTHAATFRLGDSPEHVRSVVLTAGLAAR